MLTANARFFSIVSAPVVPLITQTSTSGGSSESDEKALAVMPYACSGPLDVITVTPVPNAPSALRNSVLLKPAWATDGWAATSCTVIAA